MGILYGSTPAARIPVTTRICVTSLRLGSQSETYSIWTNGTWLDIFGWAPWLLKPKKFEWKNGFTIWCHQICQWIFCCFFFGDFERLGGFRCPKFRASYSNDSNMGSRNSSDYGTRYQVPGTSFGSQKQQGFWPMEAFLIGPGTTKLSPFVTRALMAFSDSVHG